MLKDLRRAVQWEDTFYFFWLVFVQPLLYRTLSSAVGGFQPGDFLSSENPLIALLALIAGLGALGVVVTRAPGQTEPMDNIGQVENYARLPLLVSLGLFLANGLNFLRPGLGDGAIGFVFLIYLLIPFLWSRLPITPFWVRRLLVSPMIILGAFSFTALSDQIFGGLDLRQLLSTMNAPGGLRDSQSPLSFELTLLFFGVLVFYLVFMFAPRAVAGNSGSWKDWVLRFAIYIIGAVLNLGVLQPF